MCLFHSWWLWQPVCCYLHHGDLLVITFICSLELLHLALWCHLSSCCKCFVSLLSGISPEKCVYAHLRLFKLCFLLTYITMKTCFWIALWRKCPLLRFGWQENAWLKKLRDQDNSAAEWWGCGFILFPYSRKTKEIQHLVIRSRACVPVPSPAASLIMRWVLNSVTQLLCTGRLGPASYILAEMLQCFWASV